MNGNISFTSSTILSTTKVGDIFTNDKTIIKREYNDLCKIWHPDKNNNSKESNDVMARINFLYNKAQSLIENNKWESSTFINIANISGKVYKIKFIIEKPFELGNVYICQNSVVYIINKEHKSFFQNGIHTINNFNFLNETMKKEMIRSLPIISESFQTIDDNYVVILKKPKDFLLLTDVLKYFNDKIDDRHVAWILSRLYNIVCYLGVIGLTHNAIMLDNCFISPDSHSCMLLGGWWYAVAHNTKMIGTPKLIYDILPPYIRTTKISSYETDLESIKFIGKQLLGETNGCKIRYNKDVPIAFSEWLLASPEETAIDEFSQWNKILDEAYGKRKFMVMKLSLDDLY
jgi:hypothetical protein